MPRDSALDGLRGVAIGLVVALHLNVMPGGWAGVSLFFILSGYLITSLLLDEHERTGTIVLSAFYRRRAARLGPALLLALAGMVALGAWHGYGRLAVADALIALIYLVNVARAIWMMPLTPVSWAWTLSLEEQFYGFWPPLLRRALRRGVTRPQIARVLLAVAASLMATRLLLAGHDNLIYTLVRGDEILMGAALALVPLRCPRWLTWSAVAAFIALLFVPFPTALVLVVTAASICGALIVASLDVLRPILQVAPLRYLGRISYSLYVWNGVLIAATPLHLPRLLYPMVSGIIAVASTHLVEEPLRRRLTSPGPVRNGRHAEAPKQLTAPVLVS
jgi:peptidoglycan/LPS O-acetylase OafA/YrhL